MTSNLPFEVVDDWIVAIMSCECSVHSGEWVASRRTKKEIDINRLDDILTLSDDPEEIKSAILMVHFYMNKRQSVAATVKNMLILGKERWMELISMNIDVANECLRLFRYLEHPPHYDVIELIRTYSSELNMDTLVETWIAKNWKITIALIETVKDSQIAWKLLYKLLPNLDATATTYDILDHVFSSRPEKVNIHLYSMLKTSGPLLEYMMHCDTINKDGMQSTFEAINGFDAWQLILPNPAADRIIDYCLDFYYNVRFGEFSSKESFRRWIVRHFGDCEYIGKYANKSDIYTRNVCPSFYKNVNAFGVIGEWLQMNPLNTTIINGVINAASSSNKPIAEKGLQILEYGFNDECLVQFLTSVEWQILLESRYGFDFACRKLVERNSQSMLVDLLRNAKLVPLVQITLVNAENGEEGEVTQDVKFHQLDTNTVKNIHYDNGLIEILSYLAPILPYSIWMCLFETKTGIELGMDHVEDVMNAGALFALLESPHITKEQILELLTEELVEWCCEEESLALLKRKDAYKVDLKMVAMYNRALMSDLVEYWFDPYRLMRASRNVDMEFREYLQLF